MRCNVCGKEDVDGGVQYHSVEARGRRRFRGTPTEFAPYWICPACAAYRRGTARLVYGIAAVAAAVAAMVAIAALVVRAL